MTELNSITSEYNYHFTNVNGIYSGENKAKAQLVLGMNIADNYFYNLAYDCTISGNFHFLDEDNYGINTASVKFSDGSPDLVLPGGNDNDANFEYNIEAQISKDFGIIKLNTISINSIATGATSKKYDVNTVGNLINVNNLNRNKDEFLQYKLEDTGATTQEKLKVFGQIKELKLLEKAPTKLLELINESVKQNFKKQVSALDKRKNDIADQDVKSTQAKEAAAEARIQNQEAANKRVFTEEFGEGDENSDVTRDDGSGAPTAAFGSRATSARRGSFGGQRSLRRGGKKSRRQAKRSQRRRSGRRGKRTSRR